MPLLLFYDIFFTFVSPLLLHRDVMGPLTVSGAGGARGGGIGGIGGGIGGRISSLEPSIESNLDNSAGLGRAGVLPPTDAYSAAAYASGFGDIMSEFCALNPSAPPCPPIADLPTVLKMPLGIEHRADARFATSISSSARHSLASSISYHFSPIAGNLGDDGDSADASGRAGAPAAAVASGEYGYCALGLGDLIVPGLLLTFNLRYDISMRVAPFEGYFAIGAIGYAIGLLVAQLAMWSLQRAQPALLYAVPCTVAPTCLLAWQKGLLGDMWLARSLNSSGRSHGEKALFVPTHSRSPPAPDYWDGGTPGASAPDGVSRRRGAGGTGHGNSSEADKRREELYSKLETLTDEVEEGGDEGREGAGIDATGGARVSRRANEAEPAGAGEKLASGADQASVAEAVAYLLNSADDEFASSNSSGNSSGTHEALL
jgi:hypothetical protein